MGPLSPKRWVYIGYHYGYSGGLQSHIGYDSPTPSAPSVDLKASGNAVGAEVLHMSQCLNS